MAQPRDISAELQRASAELDRLIQDVGLGHRSQREHDRREERAQLIAARIVQAFRGRDAGKPLLVIDDERGQRAIF